MAISPRRKSSDSGPTPFPSVRGKFRKPLLVRFYDHERELVDRAARKKGLGTGRFVAETVLKAISAS